jgi:hypothetical protein
LLRSFGKLLTETETLFENINISAKGSLCYYELKKHKPWFYKGCSKIVDQRKQSRDLFTGINEFKRSCKPRSNLVKDEDGDLLEISNNIFNKTKTNKLHGLSPRANYTDRATAACRRSDYQLWLIEGATWSA